MKKILYSLVVLSALVIGCTGDSAGLIDSPPFVPGVKIYVLINQDLQTMRTMVPGYFRQAYAENWVNGKKVKYPTENLTLKIDDSHITLKKKGKLLIDSDYEWVHGTTQGGKESTYFLQYSCPGGAVDSLMPLCYSNNMLVLSLTNDEISPRYFFSPVDESQIESTEKGGTLPDKL